MTSFMKEFDHLKIQLDEIKRATNSFCNQKIGAGGFGAVYEGEVSHYRGRSNVAIKHLNRQFGQGDPEFLKEIMMLSRYKHQNLISLLGFCDEEGEKVIVYEFASKGSLDRHLSDPNLTWVQRINICLGAAKGLSYLHDPKGTHQRVLHCDIKSANILLDDSLTAKVADFGLSKMGPANQQQISVVVTNVLGTPGYCDPLFMKTYTLTKESDVYSFGVVLFEVLCGRLCCQYRDGQIKVFVNMWQKKFLENKLHEIVYQHLKPQMDPTSLKLFSDVAFQCLHNSHDGRPTMSTVVEKLEKALEYQELYDLSLKLPEVYKEIISSAVPPLRFTSIDNLNQLFSNGVFLNVGNMMQARYVVERMDDDLWEKALSPENEYQRQFIDQVVSTALPESKSIEHISAAVKALMTANLTHELIELLEKIVLQNSAFRDNFNLQNLLILTAIKADSSRVMDYINRLDNFDGPAIGEVAVEKELYEEAFAIFKKFNLYIQAFNVLLDNIQSIPRAVEFAHRVSTALHETTSIEQVAAAIKAFMTAGLYHELIELLEKIVLQNSAFSGNFNLQNLLILTVIREDPSRAMDYINRLDNFDGPSVGEVAVDAELYEEAFAIYKKFNLNVQAVNVLLDNIQSIPRAVDFAHRVEEDAVWSQVAKAQNSEKD